MQQAREIMGMPIVVEIVDGRAKQEDVEAVFEYFNYVDAKFSTYKENSEISQINRGEILPADYSDDMNEAFRLSAETKKLTNDYFDIKKIDGKLDPSGLVKGWAINNAAKILTKRGFKNFYVEAGGDIQAVGQNKDAKAWIAGIRNPFNPAEIVKVVFLSNLGLATSGTYMRGQHIYNPHQPTKILDDIVSLSVLGPNIYEADRFATAAFAMGKEGIGFIEGQQGLEGYMIDKDGMATMTSGFEKYTKE